MKPVERTKYEKLLKSNHIQVTANRLLILQAISTAKQSLSLFDLETLLDPMDKSTIFRTLNLFHANRLIHSIDDGTGSLKYAICQSDVDCDVDEHHTHFHCVKCNRTFCFTDIPTPIVKLPENFVLQGINYVLTGICPECSGTEKALPSKPSPHSAG